MYTLQYDEFLSESLRENKGVKHSDVLKLQKSLKKSLLELFRISEDNFSFIGGAGKGKNDDIAKDINIAITKNSLIESNNINEEHPLFEFVKKQFERLGYEFQLLEDQNRIVVEWPFKNESVEVSIQITDNMNWLKFSRYSSNLNETESKYSGKFRECLLKAIVECSHLEITSHYNLRETPKEFKLYKYNVHEGLFSIKKSFEGKNGILKKARILEESKRLITNDPDEFAKIIFGKKVKSKDLITFESIWEHLNSKDFAYPKKVKNIKDQFKQNLVECQISVPEDLN